MSFWWRLFPGTCFFPSDNIVEELKQKLGNDKVILGLSGGVDSTVAAVLLNKAIGSNLHCIFVDNGLLRKNEFENVMESYKDLGLNVIGVNAGELFLSKLKDVTDPELKRKAIGVTFIEVFEAEASIQIYHTGLHQNLLTVP